MLYIPWTIFYSAKNVHRSILHLDSFHFILMKLIAKLFKPKHEFNLSDLRSVLNSKMCCASFVTFSCIRIFMSNFSLQNTPYARDVRAQHSFSLSLLQVNWLFSVDIYQIFSSCANLLFFFFAFSTNHSSMLVIINSDYSLLTRNKVTSDAWQIVETTKNINNLYFVSAESNLSRT